jgi:predicted nucleic acid-binding protein
LSLFVDTSALYAYLDGDDANNPAAVRAMNAVLEGEELVTHNYIVVETAALVHRRLSSTATRLLFEDLFPLMRTAWVEPDVHRAATSAFLAASRRRTSFVDWVSFEIMRREGIRRAFAYDRDYVTEGFELVS